VTTALIQALSRPEVKERFASLGVDIITLDRSAFQKYVNADFANSMAIGKAANIVINE
jgi:tripartite-type tricarboxylate transporter receptor subunit TctC